MQLRDGELRLSPSDLAAHLACAHTTTLRLADIERRGRTDAPAGEYARLIMEKGLEHEAAYRARLEGEGRRVVEVVSREPSGTVDLMRSGADVIFQAPLASGRWFGIADFLVRIDGQSALGPWSYIAVDTKLARNEAKPSHVLQLCFYSEALAVIQGRWPERAEIALGSGRPERIRLAEVMPFYRHARRMYEQRIERQVETEPYPCAHCAYCAFRVRCEEIWEAADHLSRVASIRREPGRTRSKATASGGWPIWRAAAPEDLPSDISAGARERLTTQARLQVATARRGSIAFEPLAAEPRRGLARLPRPSAGDVMFDIEGDPVWRPEQDLTFLFGLLLREGEEWRYAAIWAHDEAGERRAFEAFVDLVTARQAADPGMHVYHYSPAEPSVVRRLMARYATREAEVDQLLRTGAFVDLYAVVCQAFRVGVRSYGLKQIERLAGFERTADVGSGSGAVLAYERWLRSRAPAEIEEIEALQRRGLPGDACRAGMAPATARRLERIARLARARAAAAARGGARPRGAASRADRRRRGRRRALAGGRVARVPPP